MELLALLAQKLPDAGLPNTSADWTGWVVALLNGGFLAWHVFKSMPDQLRKKDEQIEALIADKDEKARKAREDSEKRYTELVNSSEKRLSDLSMTYVNAFAQARQDFKDALKTITDYSSREIAQLSAALHGDLIALDGDLKSLIGDIGSLNGNYKQLLELFRHKGHTP